MKQISSNPVTSLLNTTVVGQPWQKSYQLGLGVDAITGQLRASAVKPFTVTPAGQKSTEFIYSLVQSESDLQSMISGSVKAAYNLEGVNVSASTSFLNEMAVSELSVTLVAQVSIEESQYALAQKNELNVTPGEDFRSKYGDYFVAGYRAGSSLYAIYQCRFSSAEQRSKFTAAMAADVPQVFSVEGSSSFERISKEHNASVSVRIKATGVNSAIPSPPKTGWTAETIVTELLPWFNQSLQANQLETYLQHYRVIDPSISGEVPVSPVVFSELSFLYNRFWLARALFSSCPDFGRRLVEEPYHRLESKIQAQQASLPKDSKMIELLTEETNRLLNGLREINNRQVFYTQVVAAGKNEPQKDQNFDADKGTVRWSFGFQKGDLPGINIQSIGDHVEADWKIGWNEHVFSFRDSTKVIVGWDIICNWDDGTGGDWHKVSEQVIGRSTGDVFVKSDYDRGYSWNIVWYLVDANLYPVGPWLATAVHAQDFTASVTESLEDLAALWTTERMANAQPLDRSTHALDEYPLPEAGRSIVGGDANSLLAGGTTPSTGSLSVHLGPDTSRVQHLHEFPQRTVGKLFFDMNGRPCTASAVVVHRHGILTAAHCLLLDGHHASNLYFVPAYDNGNAPYGGWQVENWNWPTAWEHTQSPAWDLGLCKVKPGPDGRGVGDVVGWVGVQWGMVAGCWRNTGYPAQATVLFPFDGQVPWQSIGSQVPSAAPSIVVKHDELTAGGSGGPWFMINEPQLVNGVFSQYNIDLQQNHGPEFGPWVGEFYHGVFGSALNQDKD